VAAFLAPIIVCWHILPLFFLLQSLEASLQPFGSFLKFGH
jgi:hypothetical protein